MNDSESPPDGALDEAAERSLEEDLRQLADDARALAQAELAYQKSRAAFAGREAGRMAILGVAAAVFLFFALMALTLGLVIALTPALTAWGATAAVSGGLLLIALVCALIAAARWKYMTAALSDRSSE